MKIKHSFLPSQPNSVSGVNAMKKEKKPNTHSLSTWLFILQNNTLAVSFIECLVNIRWDSKFSVESFYVFTIPLQPFRFISSSLNFTRILPPKKHLTEQLMHLFFSKKLQLSVLHSHFIHFPYYLIKLYNYNNKYRWFKPILVINNKPNSSQANQKSQNRHLF